MFIEKNTPVAVAIYKTFVFDSRWKICIDVFLIDVICIDVKGFLSTLLRLRQLSN